MIVQFLPTHFNVPPPPVFKPTCHLPSDLYETMSRVASQKATLPNVFKHLLSLIDIVLLAVSWIVLEIEQRETRMANLLDDLRQK